MIKSIDLLKNSKIRYNHNDLSKVNDKEFKNEYSQCRVCGFFYLKEDGKEKFTFNDFEYENICNDCIKLIKKLGSEENIPYSDELSKRHLDKIRVGGRF